MVLGAGGTYTCEGGASAAVTPSRAHGDCFNGGLRTGSSLITPLEKSSFLSSGSYIHHIYTIPA